MSGWRKGRECSTEDSVHAELEMSIRIASGDVVWEVGSMNLKLQGEVKAGVGNLEPSTYRWLLSHVSGHDFLAREGR